MDSEMTDKEVDALVKAQRKAFERYSEKKGAFTSQQIISHRSLSERASKAQKSGFDKLDSRNY